ncbi:putative partitioning defective 3-like protein B [Triplophysa rosa]|uniref:Partitioning defective 3-like protein B n=1 Tax=Triplophysa rosa TaxID=992332 RepID=A0A9W7WU56_TRIRA|nr:putative partitioning defective 3-like protein B [Triplophysa rosa]
MPVVCSCGLSNQKCGIYQLIFRVGQQYINPQLHYMAYCNSYLIKPLSLSLSLSLSLCVHSCCMFLPSPFPDLPQAVTSIFCFQASTKYIIRSIMLYIQSTSCSPLVNGLSPKRNISNAPAKMVHLWDIISLTAPLLSVQCGHNNPLSIHLNLSGRLSHHLFISLSLSLSFNRAQEIFRQAMRSPIVRLEVVPVVNKDRFEKGVISHLFNSQNRDLSTRCKDPPPLKVKPIVRPVESSIGWHAELQQSSSRQSSESPLLKTSVGPSPLQNPYRKSGKRIRIDLKKGPEGLGFTVVTRDSSVHGPGPILVKNILPRGAAVKDGRLQSGDRILEVNGVDITGRTQEELVAMLRSTKQGDSVCLVVVRQEDMFLPRELKEEQARLLWSEDGKEQRMFEVPLNDSGSAGLGVSLKGNKSRETGEDLGIFIKSIIHGGAAFKDGRLRVNDQLIAVNGESLLGKSNHEAMETLRRSMSMEGNLRGMIQLVVLRALLAPNQETRRILNRSFDSCVGQAGHLGQSDGGVQSPMMMNSIYERCAVSNGGYGHVEEGDDEGLAANPHRQDSLKLQQSDGGQKGRMEQNHVKSSKSMDLGKTFIFSTGGYLDGSSLFSLTSSHTLSLSLSLSHRVELGPTLGLKKSSSLESLQTAMTEAKKNELLPFHRPRPHMVRGRGCNESFRAAIDKSYDGPPEDDDDDGSDPSSGRDTPASGSSRQGAGDNEDNKKDKKKKDKGKKKDKLKSKGKEKKKTEEASDELDKKTKKKGFGLLRTHGCFIYLFLACTGIRDVALDPSCPLLPFSLCISQAARVPLGFSKPALCLMLDMNHLQSPLI